MEIIRRVGNKKWIEKREQKLPLTNKVISENLEPFEDYMIRKVKWAEGEFLKEKYLPTKLQLKIKAVIRNKTSEESKKVQRAVEKSFKKLREIL